MGNAWVTADVGGKNTILGPSSHKRIPKNSQKGVS